jgi:L-alanine-DL-glutamate epimerase-like enolase superfamily enzyme
MRITNFQVRACRLDPGAMPINTLRGVEVNSAMEFLVYTVDTEDDSASMFGFPGRSAKGAALTAHATIAPVIAGEHVLDRERLWHDMRRADRQWGHLPVYTYGPVDCCLWLLAAQHADQPLWRYLGGFRDSIPVYVSSMFHDSHTAYLDEACAAKEAGYAAYKVHPPGTDYREDLKLHHALREAVGDDFELMSDPVQCLSLEQAVRLGRALEKLDYRWLEEPLADESFSALRELSRTLDIPVAGCEVLAKHPYSVAECIATGVVDIVRADASWSGGVTGTLKTARLAEAFHVNCEIHTAIYAPLELVNLHLCGAIANNSFLELLVPTEQFAFGLTQALPVENGVATMPEAAGLGIGLDWDLIDAVTVECVGG